jgi:hypothetical protein
MTEKGSEFTDMRIEISDCKIKTIKDEKQRDATEVDKSLVPKIKKEGELIAEIYKYQFNPVCTVVIRSDGSAVKICR